MEEAEEVVAEVVEVAVAVAVVAEAEVAVAVAEVVEIVGDLEVFEAEAEEEVSEVVQEETSVVVTVALRAGVVQAILPVEDHSEVVVEVLKKESEELLPIVPGEQLLVVLVEEVVHPFLVVGSTCVLKLEQACNCMSFSMKHQWLKNLKNYLDFTQ